MKQILRFNKIIKSIIIAGDLCILNALFVTLYYVLDTDTQRILLSDSLPQLLVLLNLVYLLCNYSKGVVLHRRIVRADHIVMRAVRNTFCHAVVFISLITLVHFGSLSTRFLVIFYTAFLALLVLYRLIFRHFVKIYRRKGGNRRTVALVGDGSNMVELYEEMTADPTSGFKVVGYFAEHPSDNYPKECRYLGTPQEVIPYLKKSKAEQFINVLLGDMSVVGPRPHMLKHTEEYSKLIDKYMVRHLVKPGITGWAQVTGFRGETKELWQMEGRVERDIWYLEHWTFMLDLYIIYKTVKNAVKGEKEAY